MTGLHIRATIILITVLWSLQAFPQVHIQGTVYDKSLNNPIAEVNVYSKKGEHTVTDSVGRYHIVVVPGDTLFFSYLAKTTNGFAVTDIHYPNGFDISMEVVVRSALPAFVVFHNSYRQDSLENRRLWQKSFDFRKDMGVRNFRVMPVRGIAAGAGLDLSMFFNRNSRKSQELIQRWLISEERENYIDHRWNKRVIAKITGLDSIQIGQFMKLYRPTYEYIQGFETQYQFYKAIKDQANDFRIACEDSIRGASRESIRAPADTIGKTPGN
jgi:hypothetical protein